MWAVGEDFFYQPAENVARSKLDEDGATVGVQLLDDALELYGLEQLLCQRALHGYHVCRVALCGGVGVDGDAGRLHARGVHGGGKRLLCVLHQRRVEGCRYGQLLRAVAQCAQVLLGVLDRSTGAREHDLPGRVVVGNADVGHGADDLLKRGQVVNACDC